MQQDLAEVKGVNNETVMVGYRALIEGGVSLAEMRSYMHVNWNRIATLLRLGQKQDVAERIDFLELFFSGLATEAISHAGSNVTIPVQRKDTLNQRTTFNFAYCQLHSHVIAGEAPTIYVPGLPEQVFQEELLPKLSGAYRNVADGDGNVIIPTFLTTRAAYDAASSNISYRGVPFQDLCAQTESFLPDHQVHWSDPRLESAGSVLVHRPEVKHARLALPTDSPIANSLEAHGKVVDFHPTRKLAS